MLINDAKSDFPEEQIGQLCKFLKDIKLRYPDLDLKHDLVGLGEVTVNREGNAHIAPVSILRLFFWIPTYAVMTSSGFFKPCNNFMQYLNAVFRSLLPMKVR
ncbi:MAG: hypothetical protein IRF12RH_05600 [Rickettsia helvetica]|uniref:Uncharacterized protein n=1 Tax=Rickettsia helvetica TaxID=35789 RepID=A0ABM9NCE7_RICHE